MFIKMLLILGVSYLSTIVIEGLVGIAFGIRKRREWFLLLVINLLTNPLTVYSFYVIKMFVESYLITGILGTGSRLAIQAVLETGVVLVEGYLYSNLSKNGKLELKHPVIYAVTANVVAWGAGVIYSCIW